MSVELPADLRRNVYELRAKLGMDWPDIASQIGFTATVCQRGYAKFLTEHGMRPDELEVEILRADEVAGLRHDLHLLRRGMVTASQAGDFKSLATLARAVQGHLRTTATFVPGLAAPANIEGAVDAALADAELDRLLDTFGIDTSDALSGHPETNNGGQSDHSDVIQLPAVTSGPFDGPGLPLIDE